VLSFEADGAPAFEPADRAVKRIPVDSTGVFRFTLLFSLPFGAGAKKDAAFRISLETFFPGTLIPVSLRFAEWLSDDRIRMEWEGLGIDGDTGEETEEPDCYYRFVIPGGKGGIHNGNGMYLEKDLILYLEARR
jgi:hypothetical protein